VRSAYGEHALSVGSVCSAINIVVELPVPAASSPQSDYNVHQEGMALGVAMKGISMIWEWSFDGWSGRFTTNSLPIDNGTRGSMKECIQSPGSIICLNDCS